MNNLKTILLACLAFFCVETVMAASMAQLKGSYVNVDANTKGITKIQLGFNGTLASVRTFGSCSPNDCDWGTVKAMVYGTSVSSNPFSNVEAVKAEYKKSFKVTTLVLVPLPNKQLMVTSMTTFTDGSGRKPYAKTFRMKRQTIVARPVGTVVRPTVPNFLKEDIIGFNYNNLRIVRRGSIYQIVDGNHAVFSAPNYSEAKQIVAVCRRYGITNQGFVGRPNPSLTYLLRGSNAPQGSMSGEDCLPFNPNNLKVKAAGGGKYRIVDGNHYLFIFPNKSEATTALQVIKKYGFTRTCFVGRPNPSLQYLRK